MTTQQRSYEQRIAAMARTKLEHNRGKLLQNGYHDTDDHGCIPWSEPIPFERVSNHPDGGSYGIRCIGENFRRWLEVHPVYINPHSSLAGAWVRTLPEMGGWRPEDRPHHLYPLHEKYHIVSSGIGAPNHFSPDMRIGLALGFGGLLNKIDYYRTFNQPATTDFYDGEESLLLGLQSWIRNHVELARQLASTEAEPDLRENLLQMADSNAWLVEKPPRTFRDACQFLGWFQVIDRMWGLGGGLGQLDELLRPYYERDCQAGLLSDEEAIWHLASLFLNDTHYSQVGGPAPDGHDLTSSLSFLILEATHRLKIPMDLAVRVHDGLDPLLLRKAVEYTLQDGTGVCFSCAEGLDRGFARNGFPRPLARMRAKVGCNWTALPGIEYSLQDVTRQSLVKPLLLALEEATSDPSHAPTMETLWDGYVRHLAASVALMKEGFDWHMAYQSRNRPEIVLNLFCHGTIERGLDVAEGGVDIVNLAVDAFGLATVADSFAAIEQRVVKEQRLTWADLMKHLKNDFAGAEAVRLMLKNIPRYGSGHARADWWAKRIATTYTDLVKGSRTPNGFNVIPGLFSHGDVYRLGKDLGATPNGRHAGAEISHSADPDPGFSRDGTAAPTAKANAVASVQPGWGNSTPLQLDIDSHLLAEEGGVEALETLIRSHNTMGGTLINLNVVSREQILAAHADPNAYPDLVVRVTGYSAYFHSLSPEYRQQIVDRFLG